jgi:hypothetical protein
MCPKMISKVCGISAKEEVFNFSNSCWACTNENIIFWIKGECK